MNLGARMAAWSGEKLLYDAEVEYLQSSGTENMEIGFAFDNSCIWRIGFKFDSFAITANCNGQTYVGSVSQWNARFAFGKGAMSWNDWYCGIGNKNFRTGVSLDSDYHDFVIDAVNDKFLIDDDEYTVGHSSFSLPANPCSARLFTRSYVNSQGTVDEALISGKVMYSQVEKSGQLISDMIPVRVGTVGYMYDRVSKQLFGNAGTGAFIVGPDKT